MRRAEDFYSTSFESSYKSSWPELQDRVHRVSAAGLTSSRHSAASLTDQNLGGGVVDSDGLQDGRSIVGHRHWTALPSTQQDLVLKRRRRNCSAKLNWFPKVDFKDKVEQISVINRTYHPLWTQSALHQISDSDGTNEGRLQRKQNTVWVYLPLIVQNKNLKTQKNKPTSRAVSAFSSSAPCLKMLTGAIDKDACRGTATINPSINIYRQQYTTIVLWCIKV